MRLEKIINITGILGGGIWCIFTAMDLANGPYWAVSARLFALNAIYFAGKFLIGAHILARSLDNLLRRW